MAEKIQIDSQSDKELRYILKDSLGRGFFMRMLYEDLGIYDSSFQCNATAYTILQKKQIGLRLLDQAKRVDFDKVQLAEKEYLDMIELERKKMEDENNG